MENLDIFKIADEWFEKFQQPARQVKTHPEWKYAALEYLKQFNIVESDFKDNSELYWFIKNRRTSFPVCPVTGKRATYKDHGNYTTYVGNVGSKDPNYIAKRKQTVIEKYGVSCSFLADEVKAKTKQTMLERYGDENYNHSPEAVRKAHQTMLERYGVEHALQSPEIAEKRKQTNLKRYGVDEIGKCADIQQKARETSVQRYGVEYAMQNKEIQQKYKDACIEKYGKSSPFKFDNVINDRKLRLKTATWNKILSYSKYVQPMFTFDEFINSKDMVFQWKNVETGEIFTSTYHYEMPKNLEKTDIEIFVKELLDQYHVDYEFRTRNILSNNKEIDFYIPSKQLGIEVGGLYWHSEVFCNRTYHYEKYKNARDVNVKLLQIFGDEIINHKQIVTNRIKNALGLQSYKIYARNCEIKEIDSKLKSKFLKKYHLQGNDSSQIRFGAFYHNHLIAVMTFGKERKLMGGNQNGEGKYEMYRFCTVSNFRCIGVASKLLTHFERQYHPVSVKTFADLRWGNGDLYEQLGFKHNHISLPNYFYVKSGIRYNRTLFQKHLLKDKLPLFDNNKSELENMKANGYIRIWDCGNAVFLKTYEQKIG